MTSTEPVASLHVHGVTGIGVPGALLRMGSHRRRLRHQRGLRFWKLLGTGDGRTFTLADADPNRWALFAVWDSEDDLRAYEHGPLADSWRSIAHESWRAVLRPIASHGTWGGIDPFAGPGPLRQGSATGVVAALTRARIRPRQWSSFARSIPAVAADARVAPGMRWSIGIGEAPIGLQATFSLWDDEASLRRFAYRTAAHTDVIERTRSEGWYAEEMFARFEVGDTIGTVDGVAW